MIKIAALNDESGEDSDSEEEVSKEALEQIAFQQYAKALDLQRKGSLSDATQLLKDLLDTELLYDVKKPAPGEKASGPLFNLKYLCYKNLASMLNSGGKLDEAIEAYSAASELDDTDVSLWHRFGQVCMQAKRYEMALYAFQRGVERNPRHWPCLDKIVTLLLALDYNEQCIATIHETLKLDPGYLRGLVYRRHIYTIYKHMREYMEYLNPIYKWKEDDVPIDEERAKVLLKEAEVINDAYVEQQEAEKFVYMVPNVTLKKPISRLTWESVGDSLVHMHHYMTEHCFSHACFIEIKFEKEDPVVEMEVCEEKENEVVEKTEEVVADTEKVTEPASEVENNEVSDKEKAVTDTEKVESDVEMVTSEAGSETTQATKTRKNPVRRRGSDLSFLQQWEWCTKRRSARKKTTSQKDYNIYDTLRAMVPVGLVPENHQEEKVQGKELSFDLDIDKMYEESAENRDEEYFGTESEQNDVKEFIKKYTENRKDIIDLLNDYLSILACKWKKKWPSGLAKIFIEANTCYSTHIDIPAFVNDNNQELLHYVRVNLLVEELLVNEKLKDETEEPAPSHKLSVIDSIEIILTVNPHIFPSIECLELILRALWLKVHIHILNKCEDFALDCLYQLQHEFDAMGEHCSSYILSIVNFTFKPLICEYKISEYIKFLERNKKLSTVKELYDRGCYEEALSIILDSFEHCKTMAKDQEAEMSLDFAVQLSLILDSYWALGKANICMKWSFICLHEALKHYFRYTSGTPEYEKWTLTVIKILCCMEHIFSNEPLSCLDSVESKELSQGLENLIRIIGHQVETNAAEMPIDTVAPWIVMHYILQREEDQGRGRTLEDKVAFDDIPNPLMLLFLGHEHLGARSWCSKSNSKLLFFILDTVVPRLRSPALSKSLEQIVQHLEQSVYCLFGHPNKKNRIKYLMDHSVTAQELDWKRAQQLYEIFRPAALPELEGKIPGITADTEALFQRILELMPSELDPQKYVPEMDKFIKGTEDKLPSVPPLLPYKMKDIYYLLGDYHFKREDRKMAVKYSTLDVIVNSDRVESWAMISLAKAANLEIVLNSCRNFNNEREFLNPVKTAVRCFKRALQLDPGYMNILIEYGNFVYFVHSFCSRVLKQASESLSMEEFEALELQKEEFLNTTFKCFTTVVKDIASNGEIDKTNEEAWLLYYMLGKVAEKKKKPPSVYLNYYMQGVKSLIEREATYPLKINYSSPTHLAIEVLELHYRIHASILKYIEQHENKPIPASVGKVFTSCIEEWLRGPYARNKSTPTKTDTALDTEAKTDDAQSVQAANILKRSISDAGEEDTHETKKLKLESAAAKIRRSASYDSEKIGNNKDAESNRDDQGNAVPVENKPNENKVEEKEKSEEKEIKETEEASAEPSAASQSAENKDKPDEQNREAVENKDDDSSSSSSSSSSSESSSSDSSSDSSCDSGRGSDSSSKSAPQAEPLTEAEIMKIITACIDALEDCASRFPPHYKAIYRLAHYHFYYKNGKDIERCRDLMLSSFVMRSGQKLGGLFSERKPSNFFNNIWKIPLTEVERAGGFAFHMSRSVLLTMEILKEIDDHKTLLDLSLHLNRIPDPDKKYLRDSDREELAQQAFSLCVQSLKGQVIKFSQQADLKSNDVEQKALKSLMLDIYRAWQRVQKQPNAKQFTNLLVDAYKLVTTTPITENMNLVDLSMKFCQSLIQALKQQATLASQNAQKKQSQRETTKVAESSKSVPVPVSSQPKTDHKIQTSTSSSSSLPKMSTQDMAAAFQNYNPLLSDSLLSQQTAAALSLSYLSNISALAGYSSLQNTLQTSIQSSLQNTFQSEFYRQFLGQNFPYMQPRKKQKRAPKATTSRPIPSTTQPKTTKSLSGTFSSLTKPIQSVQKTTSASLAPSMGTVLPSLPASMTSLAPYPPSHTTTQNPAPQAHMSTITSSMHPKPPLPHQQASPGKTLQEKLAERQKISPTVKNADINASISRLPSSLTITKTSKQTQAKKPEAKKSLSFSSEVRPKPIATDEVIVLDDDD
ncbi:calcineurin-binding protein cabin-1-like [Aricia agestis]|uniref:calcineurin-binding protein cabin-1-like n=1 Tax=Aricia agestis TaxID=91739 RepID=UPI001C202A79|nr:calcineurin-binding protein cabin-1-like [Aricia agestis]